MRSDLRGYEIAEIDLRKACREQSEKFVKELESLSGENLNLTVKRDELAEKQKVLERIMERQIALQTERSAPARVIWMEPAKAPEAPVELLPYRNMALAGLGAMLLLFLVLRLLGKRVGKSELVDYVVQSAERTHLPPPCQKTPSGPLAKQQRRIIRFNAIRIDHLSTMVLRLNPTKITAAETRGR